MFHDHIKVDVDKVIHLSMVVTLAPTIVDPNLHLLPRPIDLHETVASFLRAYPVLHNRGAEGTGSFTLASVRPLVAFMYDPGFSSVLGYVEQHRYAAVADHLLSNHVGQFLITQVGKKGSYYA